MGKLIAIGGGSNGGDFDQHLEEKIRNFIPKEHPKVVFVPYASVEFQENFGQFKMIYELLGCKVSLLEPGKENLLLQADLIYIGRGYTIPLLNRLYETNSISYLINGVQNGAFLAGFSAGAHALFSNAVSMEENIGFTMIKGLGYIDACMISHYNYKNRAEAFHELLNESDFIGIGLEDHTMLVVENNIAKAYSSKPGSNVYLIDVSNSKYLKRSLTNEEFVLPIQN